MVVPPKIPIAMTSSRLSVLVLSFALTALLPGLVFAQSRFEVRRLSEDPEVSIVDGVCHVRGAVWLDRRGPVANDEVEVVDLDGVVRGVSRTNEDGLYSVSIVLEKGKSIVMRERQGRGQRALSVRKWTHGSSFVCGKASVNVGAVESISS